jgi:sialic acid synthase
VKVKVVAEVGCNHKGNFEIAKEMISVAVVFCKAKIIKFQKRKPKELLSKSEYNSPHPVSYNSYGKTYGQHREFLEFDINQHIMLKSFCESLNVAYTTSVWDLSSAKEIVAINPKLIKIPSASNLCWEMLDYLCTSFGGKIHLSFGMTTKREQDRIITFFQKKNRCKDLVIYACTSGYPVEPNEMCLLEITRLKKMYGSYVGAVGFSGHHNGISLDIAAVTLGAEWVERHFTLNRTWKGTDHAASLEPDGLRRLIRDIGSLEEALTYKSKDILPSEEEQRKKLKHVSA